MNTEIRDYRSADQAAVVALLERVLPDDQPHNEPVQALNEKLRHDGQMLVAEYDNTIIGFVMIGYDGHRGWIYQLAVNATMRRHGAGTALIKAALGKLKACGCQKVNLQVRSDNAEVQAFYRKLGFELEPRISMGMLLDAN